VLNKTVKATKVSRGQEQTST